MVDLNVLRNRPDRDGVVAALARLPVTRAAISPFVAGESVEDAVAAARRVQVEGMLVSVRHLADRHGREPVLPVLVAAITALADAGMGEGSDLLVDLADLERARTPDPIGLSADVAELCETAEAAGMTVTLGDVAADHVDTALLLHASLGGDHPGLGLTVSANLLRSEADCGDLARAGARVRLVRHVAAAQGLAYDAGHDVDKAYVRCTRVLLAGGARPVIATREQTLTEIATSLAIRNDVEASTYTFEFPLGVRQQTAADLVSAGMRVSIGVPFGPGWPSYAPQQMTASPASVGRALRAVIGR